MSFNEDSVLADSVHEDITYRMRSSMFFRVIHSIVEIPK